MANDDYLKNLFNAFREKNDSAFFKTAELIISEQLASNHHAFATELKKALGSRRHSSSDLAILPKDRRHGEDLVQLRESVIDFSKVVLPGDTQKKLDRVIAEHRNRAELAKYGFLPKCKLLFWGPPGCGKTLSASMLAYELGLPLGIVRLNAVISSFLGDTASNLQKIFDLAASQPMVLLLDEIDAMAKSRDDRQDVGELKRVVNSLLQAMDNFESSQSIVIATSNHQYMIDEALWRRFDDLIEFRLPGPDERERFIDRFLNGIKFSGATSNIARELKGLSYAQIERILSETIKSAILQGDLKLASRDILEQYREFIRDFEAAKGVKGKERNVE